MKHMSMKFLLVVSLALLVSVTMPIFASANGLQYSARTWGAQNSVILNVQEWEKERGGSWIPSYGSEMFREPREKSSDTDMRSYSDTLGPSFDIPRSVDGHSRGTNPWWDRGPSSADPMVEDLSRKDGGGFSSPGNGWGSAPGYHGR